MLRTHCLKHLLETYVDENGKPGLSLYRLGKITGINRGTLSDFMNYKGNLRPEQIKKVCEVLNCDQEQLFTKYKK